MPNSISYDAAALRTSLLACLADQANAYPEQTVRQFPHIAARLIDVWGTPEGEHYLQDLLVCDRSDRHGFPDDVASEIFRLSVIHSGVVEEREGAAGGNTWGDPTEIQLRTNRDALRRIAEQSAMLRRQRGMASAGAVA